MAPNRRPLSLGFSLALGLGAAMLVLLAGGHPAAAAPVRLGDAQPAAVKLCFARDDSAPGTIYSTFNSAAVRQAVAAAVPNDFIRLAGNCAGAVAQAGTTQTVVITQPLTLEGGYTFTDWVDSFPITQPTTLDAYNQGRVITASANFTISALTVQHGYSGGGKGGGIFARSGLTLINPVNILSNTTLPTPIWAGAWSGPDGAPGGARDGGGVWGGGAAAISFIDRPESVGQPSPPYSLVASNDADNGGGVYGYNVNLAHVTFRSNYATTFGGGLSAFNNLVADSVAFIANHGDSFGAGFESNGPATFTHLDCESNIGVGGGCGAIAGYSLTISGCTMAHDRAIAGAGVDAFTSDVHVTECKFNDEKASRAGAVMYAIDAPVTMANNLYIANTAPQGSVLYAQRLIASNPILNTDKFSTDSFTVPVPHLLTNATRQVNPLVSSTAPTGSAYYASGVTIFVTDAILAGNPLDFETGTAASSVIHEDYNLFDHTPVISGTAITTGTNSLVGDPLFSDAVGHLGAGSPAIDHGIDVGINTDLDGNPRPSGAGFDIGAYEVQVAQVALAKLFLPLVRR